LRSGAAWGIADGPEPNDHCRSSVANNNAHRTSAKLIGYFKLPTVQHYLIIDPDACSVRHHSRSAEDSISATRVTSAAIQLEPPGSTVDLSEFFE
jgi:hypothetical protein